MIFAKPTYTSIARAAAGLMAATLIAIWAASVASGAIFFVSCILGWTLLALSVMDLRTQRLGDALTLPLMAAGLAAGFFFDTDRFIDHIAGAVIGVALIVGISLIYRTLRGRDGIGLGDAKLLGAGGAWIAWQGLPSVLLIATFAALLAAFAARGLGYRLTAQSKLPFGPFLALGIWLVWLYGPLIP